MHPISINTLTQLHYYLFQDIYPFAGKIRNVQLMKGQTRFCQAQFIESNLKGLFQQLKGEPTWDSVALAAEKLAYYKTELNLIHPFREGNGRVIRLVIRELAFSRGLIWDFTNIDRSSYLEAMILATTDNQLLVKLFQETLIKRDN